ncbi:MAG: metallophosphoesterase family protein [Burkholderiales bacterium]|jgi:putative phosphoesterase|nr:metallophosphoesterase family protein [Burkholderiales bacterium]
MKIAVVSDSHDHGDLLVRAIEIARDWGAQAVLHCGDVIGANTLRRAMGLGLPMHVIHGNNLGDIPMMSKLAFESGGALVYYGAEATLELGERRLFMIHYPHLARAMALTGDYDAVFCGHSHQAEIEKVAGIGGGHTWLVNPGTVAGFGEPRTLVLGDLAALSFSVRALQ